MLAYLLFSESTGVYMGTHVSNVVPAYEPGVITKVFQELQEIDNNNQTYRLVNNEITIITLEEAHNLSNPS